MAARIRSSRAMSNTGYHQNGKPTWWARVGEGTSARFLRIPWTRGDHMLDVVVEDLEPGETVYIGAGKGTRKTVRETVEAEEVEVDEEVEDEA